MSDVITLHGAWPPPVHYAELAELLRARNLSVEVPDLYELSLEDRTALVEDLVAAPEGDGRPEPPSIFGATPTRVSWHDTPSVYLAAPLVSRPDAVAELIQWTGLP